MNKNTKKESETKFGRPRKYKPAEFREAVGQYFNSIISEIPAKDEFGKPILNRLGKQITRSVYVIPPSVAGICVALKIDPSTFDNYASDEDHPEYGQTVRWAKQLIRAYLEEELLTRRKGIQGVIFNLQNNYNWKEKREVEIGEDTRKDMGASLSLEEKLQMIADAASQYSKTAERDKDPE